MSDILLPLYLALACLFLAMTLAALPGMSRRLAVGERARWYGVASGAAATVTCVLIALTPMLGRGLLALSVVFLWASVLASVLRVRSWHRGRHPTLEKRSMLALTLACVVMLVQFFTVDFRPARAALQMSVSLILLGWLLLEIYRASRKERSLQLVLMAVGTLGMLAVISVWAGLIFSGKTAQLVQVSALFKEDYLTFVMRFFIIACLALVLISANGFGLARMVKLKSEASDQKAQSDQLNQQLQQLLNEKEEMLQALSFAARSQNLPAIMSSLSHEINQPLGAIRLNADSLLAEDASLIPLERTQMLQQLVAGSITATEVVRDFRRFLEANITPPGAVDLSLLLSDLVRGFQTELTRRGVQVVLRAHPSLRVRGDPVQLESALTGALLYMLKREDAPTRQMEIQTVCIGQFVHLHLLDDGPPVTTRQFAQALDRMGQDMKHHFSQSLWLSRAIVEHHGGAMNVHEENGRTGISLHLPLLENKP